MRKLILSIFLLLPVQAFTSSDLPLPNFPQPGTFVWANLLNPQTHLDVVIVHAWDERGIALLEKQRSLGYSCFNTGRQIYRCSLVKALPEVSPENRIALENRFANEELAIQVGSGRIELLHDSENYQEWRVWYPVVWRGQKYPYYRVIALPGIAKLSLGAEVTVASFRVLPQGSLLLWQEITTSTPQGFRIESIEVGFRN